MESRSQNKSIPEGSDSAMIRKQWLGARIALLVTVLCPLSAASADTHLERRDITVLHNVRSVGKTARRIVEYKVRRWLPRSVIVVSLYRLLPQATHRQQDEDIAHALALAQEKAGNRGGAADKFILMGHSDGAHRVALRQSTAHAHPVPWRPAILNVLPSYRSIGVTTRSVGTRGKPPPDSGAPRRSHRSHAPAWERIPSPSPCDIPKHMGTRYLGDRRSRMSCLLTTR